MTTTDTEKPQWNITCAAGALLVRNFWNLNSNPSSSINLKHHVAHVDNQPLFVFLFQNTFCVNFVTLIMEDESEADDVWNHCWTLERVPKTLESSFVMKNSQEKVKVGRKVGNHKVCSGVHVSREHLQFIRSGRPDDWRTIRWSIECFGGLTGTFVNRKKIQKNKEIILNDGDKIGVTFQFQHQNRQ